MCDYGELILNNSMVAQSWYNVAVIWVDIQIWVENQRFLNLHLPLTAPSDVRQTWCHRIPGGHKIFPDQFANGWYDWIKRDVSKRH